MCRAGPARAAAGAAARIALCAATLLLAGCSAGQFDATLDRFVKKVFAPRRTPQQYMLVAVSDSDPDLRRRAVAKIAASRQGTADWAIKGFVAIALLEDDPQTRCAAIRALARTRDPRALETLLKILGYRRYRPAEVRPPGRLCRWDATAALADLAAAGLVPAQRRPELCALLRERLRSDPARHVRIAAARGLGCFRDAECVRALIDGLRDEDFAVAYECESSLVRLTGRTHACSALEWNRWFEQNRTNLFAAAGQIPAARRPPYSNRWEKFAHQAREFLRWLYPGGKQR